ncbi:MAG TPA: asparagine synthase (glutamine-hydrolyzing) [Longimicrobiales bacterium]|nr:asparagine synthase (glutamine-hydrolyzing) [Longimicrobiales bacterium]
MCGIVGVARRQGAPQITRDEIANMCELIRHRGPDEGGMHVSGHVGLGMRRLSIIDLAEGHQPIYNEDGTKVLVFNGEIYNYRELRRGLLERGHRFKTNSDTETIVHLYEELGADCVKQLRGMFGIALWDETRGSLLLARDRFGIKPLYFATTNDQIVFASELKALFETGLLEHRLDWRALEMYLRLGYIPAPYTPFEGVRKLEPGHVLTWKQDGTWTDEQYWDLPQHESNEAVTPASVLGWIDESVTAHLVSDVPMAVLLSGGLDSSAVFSSMAMSGASPHAFTARYLGSGAADSDETGLARELVNRYGGRLTIVDIEPDVSNVLERAMYSLDEPHADESAIPTWLLSQRVAQDYKVVLAGTGGDELFGGYRRHFGLLASNWYTGLPPFARSLITSAVSTLPEPRNGQLSVHRLKRFVRTEPGSVPARYYAMLNKLPDIDSASLFAPELRAQVGGAPAAQHLRALYEAGGEPRGLKAALYMDYKTYLPDDILHLSDRIAMAHSLEVRVPLVDHLLVERIFPLSDRAKVGRGKAKQLLRRALASRLPQAHFSAKKRGFVGPTAMWLRNELRDMVIDELSPARIGQLGFFDTDAVTKLVDDHMTRRHNREAALWALLSFAVWHRVFVEQPATPAAAR